VIAVAGIAVPALRQTLYPFGKALGNLDSSAFDFALPTRAAQFRFDVRLVRDLIEDLFNRRVANFIVVGFARFAISAAELLFTSTVIQIALALPMAWYFHRATTMALPANALVIPIAGILLPAAVVAVAASYVSHWLAWLPALTTRYALDALTGTIRVIGHLRVSDVRVPTPALLVCCAATVAFGLALVLARRRMIWVTVGLTGLLAAAIWIVLLPPKPSWRPGVLEVTAIDVGQGDSLLLITPEGKTLLMDAGGMPGNARSDFDVGEEVVSPYLWSRGIRRLDAVAISHAHSDHMGGMRSVISNFQPRELWYGVESPTRGFLEVEQAARSNNVSLKSYVSGESFEFGAVHVRVLNPQPGWQPHDPAQDDESLALRLQYGGSSVLLVGDSHKPIEKLLVDEAPQSDLLKVGHHGSATSSSPGFLAAVKPRYAVVSVGFYNSFKHPRPEVMKRYADAHIPTYRTDLAGAVTFYLDGTNITAWPAPR
jgi:competence protein ComEC